jgi:hypothetical protein
MQPLMDHYSIWSECKPQREANTDLLMVRVAYWLSSDRANSTSSTRRLAEEERLLRKGLATAHERRRSKDIGCINLETAAVYSRTSLLPYTKLDRMMNANAGMPQVSTFRTPTSHHLSPAHFLPTWMMS